MSAITPVTSMPANSASPSGMVTTSLPKLRFQAVCTDGAADLYLLFKLEGGQWAKLPGAVLRLDSAVADKAAGQLIVENPIPSTSYHVLQERSGTVAAYLSGSSASATLTDLSVTNLAAGGTLGVTGAATLSSTLAVTGASTLTGQLNANGGEKLAGSSPAAAADAVGLGVADVNGATTAGLVKTFEGGGVEQERVMSTSATIKRMTWSESVADDATITLPLPTNLGIAVVTTYDESLTVTVKSDGTCTKISGTTNTDVADTDAKLDVYNNTTDVKVKNRLGGSRHVRVSYTVS